MEDIEIFHLNLAAPLFYNPMEQSAEKPGPFDFQPKEGSGAGENTERLYCFELDEVEYLKFEPDENKLPGKLVFEGEAGIEGEVCTTGKVVNGKSLQLPAGKYLFAQKREILCREKIIDLMVEIQMEGLWQRLKPGKKLYLRYLFEDGSWVTQLFRPLG